MAMEIFQQRPQPRLQAFVDRFWAWRGAPGEAIRLPTLLPGTGAELFIHAGRPFSIGDGAGSRQLAPTQLFCLRESRRELLPEHGLDFIAARFRIGALQRFLAAPVAEVQDRDCEAGELWGSEAEARVARVCSETDFSRRVGHLEVFLLNCLHGGHADPLIETAVAALYNGERCTRVHALAAAHDLGIRQFERRFSRMVGLSPARLRRLVRFQRVVREGLLRLPAARPQLPLLDAALGQGYYDEAHFIRDFRELAGDTPTRFFRGALGKTHFYNPSRAAIARVPSVL